MPEQSDSYGEIARWGFIFGMADAVWAETRPPDEERDFTSLRLNLRQFREAVAFQLFDEVRRRQFLFGYERGYGKEIGVDMLDLNEAEERRVNPPPEKHLGPAE